MSSGSLADGLGTVCHVVWHYPALRVALCAVGGVQLAAMNVTAFESPSLDANVHDDCGVVSEGYVAIDTTDIEYSVNVGDCVEEYMPIGLAQLLERCEAFPADNELCARLRQIE